MEEQNAGNQQISDDKYVADNGNKRYLRAGIIRGALVTFLVMIVLVYTRHTSAHMAINILYIILQMSIKDLWKALMASSMGLEQYAS